MKSDVICVKSDGTGVREALAQAEKIAAYGNLSKKESIRLRLLTEETMGMLGAITGPLDADFWIDEEKGEYRLHLATETLMNSRMRSELLSASTSGTNAAAKGVMGKIRDVFEKALEPADSDFSGYYDTGWYMTGGDAGGVNPGGRGIWSLNHYKDSVRKDAEKKPEWDELEKSIVANLADEVSIGIKSGTVEMTVFIKFSR